MLLLGKCLTSKPLLLLPNPHSAKPSPSSVSDRLHRVLRRCRRSWFSNAEEEPWSNDKRSRRRWWSAVDEDEEEQQKEDLEFEFDDEFGSAELFEEPWEKIWFFKIFKSYGYLLPFIAMSMIITSGLKAFVLALAIPLGQSAISLAMDTIWGKDRHRQRSRSNTRRQPFARSNYSNSTGREKDEGDGAYSRRQSYQSWVSGNADYASKGGPYRKSGYGGWDELDVERNSSDSRKRSSPSTGTGDAGLEAPMRRMSRRMGKYKEAPLFMRLLVAVFPFLGSWFRIL